MCNLFGISLSHAACIIITMETNPLPVPSAPEVVEHRRTMRPILASMAGILLVAGCSTAPLSGERDNPLTHGAHQSDGSAHSNACVKPRVPVYPREHFKRSNREDIARQLQALHKAHRKHASVSTRDVINAGAIVTDSMTDPIYAEAFTYANKSPQRISARELLQKDFSAASAHCLQRDQLHQTHELYRTLVNGLGPKVGHQMSTFGKGTYQKFKQGLKEFNKEYGQKSGNSLFD